MPLLIECCHAYAHGATTGGHLVDDSARRILHIVTSVVAHQAQSGASDESGGAVNVLEYPVDFTAAMKKWDSEIVLFYVLSLDI